jgi:hypothetical protein
LIDPGAEGLPPIHRAARDGDVEEVARLLDADPSLNDAPISPAGDAPPLPTHPVTGELVPALTFDRMGRDKPLHTASRYARIDAVDLLLRRGASPESRGELGRTAVHYAAYYAVVPLVDLLAGRGAGLDAGDDLGWTPLDAARKGENGLTQEAAGRLLVDRGATPDLAAALWLGLPERARAILAGGPGPVRESRFPDDLLPLALLLLKDHARRAGLRVRRGRGEPGDIEGAVEADLDIFDRLIAYGAPLSDGYAMLSSAVRGATPAVVERLLACGLDTRWSAPVGFGLMAQARGNPHFADRMVGLLRAHGIEE